MQVAGRRLRRRRPGSCRHPRCQRDVGKPGEQVDQAHRQGRSHEAVPRDQQVAGKHGSAERADRIETVDECVGARCFIVRTGQRLGQEGNRGSHQNGRRPDQ